MTKSNNPLGFDPHQPAEIGQEFSIPGCRGLRLRVGATSRTWFMRYRQPTTNGLPGKLREGRIGSLDTTSLIQAIAVWQERRATLKKGADPFADEKAAKAEQRSQKEQFSRKVTTVQKMAEEWLEKHADHNARGWETRRMLTQELGRNEAFANLQADDLRLAEVADFLEKIIARPAPAIARMVRQALGQAFEWAAGNGLVSDTAQNQFKRVLRGDRRLKQNKKSRTLSEVELAMFFPWLETAGLSVNIQSILKLILLTAMRPGEVAGMAWSNIDLANGVYRMPNKLTKTGKGREVQLNTQAIALLRSLANDKNQFVFQGKRPLGKTFSMPMTAKSITVGMGLLKIPRPVEGDAEVWTPHDLRRTVRTGLAKLGCPMEIGELILGHAVGAGVAETYNRHRYLDEQREWLQKWGDYLDTMK